MMLGLFPILAIGVNLLANPSFDEGLAYWGVSQYSGVVIEAVTLDPSDDWTGACCEMSCTKCQLATSTIRCTRRGDYVGNHSRR